MALVVVLVVVLVVCCGGPGLGVVAYQRIERGPYSSAGEVCSTMGGDTARRYVEHWDLRVDAGETGEDRDSWTCVWASPETVASLSIRVDVYDRRDLTGSTDRAREIYGLTIGRTGGERRRQAPGTGDEASFVLVDAQQADFELVARFANAIVKVRSVSGPVVDLTDASGYRQAALDAFEGFADALADDVVEDLPQ